MKSIFKNFSNQRSINILGIFLAIIIDLIISKTMASWSYSWLPVQASTAAPYVDNLFAFETGIGTFIFLGCSGVIAWVLIFNRAPKYDESYGEPIEGNTKLEIVWTLLPLLLVIAIAIYSTNVNNTLKNLGNKSKYDPNKEFIEYSDNREKNTNAPIDVIARQWNWEFVYPEGFSSSELHLTVNKKVNFRLISEDVIHGFYIPAFRLKQDIIPGSIISYSLTPTRTGVYRLRDSMFSGTYFSQNQTNVIVETNESYKNWIKTTVKKVPVSGLNQAGILYKKRLENGDRGWATVPPTSSPMVNDPGHYEQSHEG
tara:strand:- start:452 stop:1390 length:939 start_codon:yes stop_codon:yes gene_type:complete